MRETITTYLSNLWDERGRLVRHWATVTLILMILVGLLAGIIGPAYYLGTVRTFDPTFKVWVDGRLALDLDESLALAQRLDRLMDKINQRDPDWRPEATPDMVEAWVLELAPMYHYEGASHVVVYPHIIYRPATNGFEHNHIGGRSNCFDKFLLNLRYMNPVSHWHERNWLAVMAHELAHNHQTPANCSAFSGSRVLTESTAQLMSWEVLASLANKGNKVALYTLIEALQDEFEDVALYHALTGSKADREIFENALAEMQGYDAGRWAAYQKMLRFWSDKMDELKDLLGTYSATPINLLSAYRHDGRIPKLAMATTDKTLAIDDLLYVLANAEELVNAQLSQPAELSS